MGKLTVADMRQYLSKSISSLNQNKLNGILAEIDFRKHLENLGFSNRISLGGWIVRNVRDNNIAHHTSVFFPDIMKTDEDYKVAIGA